MIIPATLAELTWPAYGESAVAPLDHDLTRQHEGKPLGERITVSGRALGQDGKPLRGQLAEVGTGLTSEEIRDALEPATYLGSAGVLADTGVDEAGT